MPADCDDGEDDDTGSCRPGLLPHQHDDIEDRFLRAEAQDEPAESEEAGCPWEMWAAKIDVQLCRVVLARVLVLGHIIGMHSCRGTRRP